MTPLCSACATPLAAAGPLEGLCPRCVLDVAAAAPATSVDLFRSEELETVRSLFPELDVESEIGRGGMGVVYRARQRKLDRPVALKLVSPHLSDQDAFADRFGREARAMARLSHPGIVGVHDFGEREGLYYLVMEHVDGVNLRAAMRAGTIDPAAAVALVPRLCEALEYAHAQGVVHRDIKPENILLGPAGSVKIVDFGLAKLGGEVGGTLTRTSQVLGTPHYMAPEQVHQPLAVDHRADLYSLGVVLYEMLTGELPVGAYPPPSSRPGVDARLDRVVKRTLEREPDSRYQHASEIADELGGLTSRPAAAAAAPAAAGPALWTVPESLTWTRSTAEGGALLGLVAAAGALVWLVAYDLYWADGYGRDSAPFAAAYPLAMLAVLAAQAPWTRYERWRGLTRLVGIGGALAALALCSLGGSTAPIVSCIAVLPVVVAQGFLDRWVDRGTWVTLSPAVVLAVVGGLLYGSGPGGGRDELVLDYATGLLAILAGTSLALRMPLFLREEVPRPIVRMGARALVFGVLMAIFYFRGNL